MKKTNKRKAIMIVLCTFCTKTIGNNYKNKINRTAKQNINIRKQKFIPVSKIKTGEKTSKTHLTQRINMRQPSMHCDRGTRGRWATLLT